MLGRLFSRLFGASKLPAFRMPDDDELIVAESGLRYLVLREGSGQKPRASHRVTVHYTGWHTDGRVFDSSMGRGKPVGFALGSVIPGWREGLQLMQEGAAYLFVVPPELGYGERGAPPAIGPNETLVFHVELLHLGG